MNAARRKELAKAQDLIEKIKSDFEALVDIIEAVAPEEREFYDNMPENMQSGDKGTAAENSATLLEEVQYALEQCDLDDLSCKIEDAKS
jgi:hypothetical protein